MKTTLSIEDLTRQINFLRERLSNQELVRETINHEFEFFPYGSTHKFIFGLIKFGILYQTRNEGPRKYYELVHKPIHKDKVKNLVEWLRSIHNIKGGRKDPVEDAIILLKSKGYVIFKPI